VSAFLDASQIYGGTTSETNKLRLFQTGNLTVSNGTVSRCPYLPVNSSNLFYSGDGRVNENMALTSVHTLFLREHNRISSTLSTLNTGWNDERLFQVTFLVLHQIVLFASMLTFEKTRY
jgi:peroxidase